MENTEIWLPDVTVYNAYSGLMETFEPSIATVRSDGLVEWSRVRSKPTHPTQPASVCRSGIAAAFAVASLHHR